MNAWVRRILAALAVAFTAYLAVGGLLWRGEIASPVLLCASLALFLVVTWLCIFWRSDVGPDDSLPGRLPAWAAVLALATAVLVPSATWLGAGDEARLLPFATWSLGGLSALMTIVMVRGRAWVAWLGVAIVLAEATWWIGLADALALGGTGAVVWVGVAQLLTWMMDRAARDTQRLTEVQRASSELLAAQRGRRRERRIQVQRALDVAGPVLVRTIESGGQLTEDERREARAAEGRLRDEMRGRRLLDDDVRAQLDAARARGTHVTLLDEGGLDELSEPELERVRSGIAAALVDAQSDRLYIRTSPHPDVAATVVGRSAGETDRAADEVVDLWVEVVRPRREDDDESAPQS